VIRKTSPAWRRSAISSRPARGGLVRHSASVKIWRTAVPFAEKSGSLVGGLGTHWGRKIADCNGTQPNATRRKMLINQGLLGYKSVRLNAVEYGQTRLRIWGSGVRTPPSAPLESPGRVGEVSASPLGRCYLAADPEVDLLHASIHPFFEIRVDNR